jgi:putative transposase
VLPLQVLLTALVRWILGEQHEVIEYLKGENRVLKAQLRGRRVRLSDAERRRLAILGAQLGRPILTQVATLVTADTILRWHRDLSVRQRTVPKRRPGRPRVHAARSTVANILKERGIPPSSKRPMSWRTFLGAHRGAIRGEDFFTADIWMLRGWLTYYATCVTELRSRGVRFTASPPYPYERGMSQVVRQPADVADAELVGPRGRICDPGRAWSTDLHHRLQAAGVRLIRARVFASSSHAHAQRFVSSIQEACVNRAVRPGEGLDRRAIAA